MTNVIPFPRKDKRLSQLPSQRVFYIGYRYVGPFLFQEVQQLYLKRKGLVYGERWWAMITYGKYDESDRRTYSIELEECHENDVPDMLDMFDVGQETNFAELEAMGWRGNVSDPASDPAPVKSIFHRCYDELRFPEFASPLKAYQFNGRKMGIQSKAAENFLDGKPLHSYTFFGRGDDAWVWMRLETFDGRKVKIVPVSLKDQLPDNFTKEFLIKRCG
jgi:hypothetical protein